MTFVEDLYLGLIEQGWTLPDIDGMDILFYFRLLRRKREKGKEPVYVDQVAFL